MSTSFRLQQQALFKQFTDLSERAAKHWPLPDPLKKAEKDPRIGYEFKYITKQVDLEENAALVEDFFALYRQEENFFSGSFDPTIYEDEATFKSLQTEILSNIPPAKSQQHLNSQVCAYLILAHKSGKTDDGRPAHQEGTEREQEIPKPENERAQAGCIVYFFPKSGTLLIKTVLIAQVLQSEREQKVDGLLKEYGFNEQTVEDNKEKNKQQVLQWLLTYENPQNNREKSALVSLIEQIGTDRVSGVFHEVLNPVLITTQESQQKAATNLTAFHAIEARYLRFAYHHPTAAIENRRKCRQYFLLTFPKAVSSINPLIIDSATIMRFIIDYGKYLFSDYPEKSYLHDIAACKRFRAGSKTIVRGFWNDDDSGPITDPISLNNTSLYENRFDKHFTLLYLHNVPRPEQPRFIYRRASVGFEILVDEDYFEPIGIHPYHDMTPPQPELTPLGHTWNIIRKEWGHKQRPNPNTLYCPVAHSGETDLFSFKYQAEPPYFTRYYTVQDQIVDVKFPSYFEFTSEGRMECFYQLPQSDDQPSEQANHDGQKADDQQTALTESLKTNDVLPRFSHTVRMKACISYTYFLKSAVRVWHLVLKPDASDISELDIIKLMRFFSGSQEHESEDKRREQMRQIEFSIPSRTSTKARSRQKRKRSSFLLDRFPLPVFKPEPGYDKNDRRIQKIAWYVQTGSRFVGWLAIGLVIVWLWRWQLPEAMKTVWQWQPTLFYEKALYWLVGIFALSRAWSWLFDGIEDLIRDLFSRLGRKIRGLFIREDGEEKMPWLEKPDNLIQLLEDLTGVRYEYNQNNKLGRLLERADQAVSLRNIRSGVVEIDTGDNSPEQIDKDGSSADSELLPDDNFLGFRKELDPHLTPEKRNEIRKKVKELYKSLNDGEIPMSDEPDAFTAEEYADYVFKAYCGICLGIFDYDRMGFQEIDDTLVPLPDSKTESSFMVIHRGVLAMLGYGDDVMDTFWETLGINAYLLIPSAVLAHNDMVSRDAENRLNKLLNDLRTGKSRLTIPELIEQRNVIDDLLNDDILGDVFQYKTEQELYKEGMERRGIAERVKDAHNKLEQLDKLISTKQEERTSEYQRRIQYIVTIVGAFSFYQIVHDFFVDELAKDDPNTKDKFVNFEDIPTWFLLPIRWLSGITQRIFHLEVFPIQSCYDPLDLAHLAIQLVFVGLLVFMIISVLFDPNKSRKHFWQRRNRHRSLPKTHAPNSPNRSSAAKRTSKR